MDNYEVLIFDCGDRALSKGGKVGEDVVVELESVCGVFSVVCIIEEVCT